MAEHRVLVLEGATGGRAAENPDPPSHHRVQEDEEHWRMVRSRMSVGESVFQPPTGWDGSAGHRANRAGLATPRCSPRRSGTHREAGPARARRAFRSGAGDSRFKTAAFLRSATLPEHRLSRVESSAPGPEHVRGLNGYVYALTEGVRYVQGRMHEPDRAGLAYASSSGSKG